MTLGLFLAIGESLTDFKKKGQLARLINYNVAKYSQAFDKVYIFSYENESFDLPGNCQIVGNKYHLHRYFYSFLLPLIHANRIRECHVLRGLQITGGIPATVTKILLGKRFIVNYGYDYSEVAQIEGKSLQALLYKVVNMVILSFADKIIVPANTLAQKLASKYQNKTVYIPNGVDTKLFYPAKTKKPKTALSIIFMGRLEEQKNLKNLIKAAANLKVSYTLNFYGGGSLEKSLIKLSKSIGVPLIIRKPVAYENVAKILRSCDIFVLPSYKEGSPKILLEAMSSGCAIVASDIPEIREIIENGENGILSDTNAEDLTRALNKLIDFKTRQRLGHHARKTVINKHEISKLLTKEVDIIRSLAQ